MVFVKLARPIVYLVLLSKNFACFPRFVGGKEHEIVPGVISYLLERLLSVILLLPTMTLFALLTVHNKQVWFQNIY